MKNPINRAFFGLNVTITNTVDGPELKPVFGKVPDEVSLKSVLIKPASIMGKPLKLVENIYYN